MPKRPSTYASDDGFVEDAPHQPKRSKTKPSASSSKPAGSTSTDENGDVFFQLNDKGTRRITVNEFKGKWMVNVREYYEKDGKMLPGKKGISLTMEQYDTFVKALPAIESVLGAKGQDVARPDYDGAPEKEAKMEDVDDDGADEDQEEEKKNFEATSEEDE